MFIQWLNEITFAGIQMVQNMKKKCPYSIFKEQIRDKIALPHSLVKAF